MSPSSVCTVGRLHSATFPGSGSMSRQFPQQRWQLWLLRSESCDQQYCPGEARRVSLIWFVNQGTWAPDDMRKNDPGGCVIRTPVYWSKAKAGFLCTRPFQIGHILTSVISPAWAMLGLSLSLMDMWLGRMLSRW